jgi:hypothetical protein
MRTLFLLAILLGVSAPSFGEKPEVSVEKMKGISPGGIDAFGRTINVRYDVLIVRHTASYLFWGVLAKHGSPQASQILDSRPFGKWTRITLPSSIANDDVLYLFTATGAEQARPTFIVDKAGENWVARDIPEEQAGAFAGMTFHFVKPAEALPEVKSDD